MLAVHHLHLTVACIVKLICQIVFDITKVTVVLKYLTQLRAKYRYFQVLALIVTI